MLLLNAVITVWKPACDTCEDKENSNHLTQLPFFNQNKDHQKGLLCLLRVQFSRVQAQQSRDKVSLLFEFSHHRAWCKTFNVLYWID